MFSDLPGKAEVLQLPVGGGGRGRGGRAGHTLGRVPQGPPIKQAGQPLEWAVGRILKGNESPVFKCFRQDLLTRLYRK